MGEAVPQRAPSWRRRLGGTRPMAAAAVVGGLGWVLYGPLTMLSPWGADVVYDASVGYSLVIDATLFLTYSLPGSLALVLSAGSLVGLCDRLGQRRTRLHTAATWLARLALALGVVSLVGVVALFDPVFTAARIFGTLALGAAALLASVVARASAGARWASVLLLLGALGLFLMPLWPLVHALRWVSEEGGALLMALFGAGWVRLGWRLWQEGAAVAPLGAGLSAKPADAT